MKPELGQLIDHTYPYDRDAVHIAVLPVSAIESLKPGQLIRLAMTDNTRLVVKTDREQAMGIVDPYLSANVKPGQHFWMFMLPNTIDDLRHSWSHIGVQGYDPVKDAQTWVSKFAEKHDLTYRQFMDAAKEWVNSQDGYVVRDDPGLSSKEWQTFWIQYQLLTGVRVKEDDKYSFIHEECCP